MKKGFIVAAFALLSVTACKKNIETPNDNPATAQSFKEIKSEDQFNWQTEKELTIKVQGLSTATKIVNTFKVMSADEQVTYFSSLQAMDANWEQKIKLPSHVTEVKMSFGSITKTIKPAAGTLEFDYLTENAEEVL